MTPREKRRLNGTTFKPGNPGGPGRPKGSKSLMTMIREQTRDGAELVEIMLRIARDADAKAADVMRACEFLADRGFGKVAQPIEGAAEDGAIVVRWRDRDEARP